MIASGNQKYIGARYVPIIMGDWSASIKYEPLMVVLYQGTSYTSKTTVPTGVLPTNEIYWVKTGDYNAQVEQYRQEVAIISEEITKKVPLYANLESMKADNSIKNGMVVETSGFYNVGDLGGTRYLISNIQPLSYYESLNNGLFASPILSSNVNIQVFGAIGDYNGHTGTNNLPFFERAINYIFPGCELIISKGDFLLGDNWEISKSDVIICIMPSAKIRTILPTTKGETICFRGTEESILKNGKIYGGGTIVNYSSGTNENGIGVTHWDGIVIDGLNFPEINRKAITLQEKVSNAHITNNKIGTVGTNGITVETTCKNVWVENNVIENSLEPGIVIMSTSSTDNENIFIIKNNVLHSVIDGIYVASCKSVSIIGNAVYNAGARGIACNNCEIVICENNSVFTAGTNGAHFGAITKSLSIDCLLLDNCSSRANGASEALFLSECSIPFLITRCKILGNQHKYAVLIAMSSGNRGQFSNNDFSKGISDVDYTYQGWKPISIHDIFGGIPFIMENGGMRITYGTSAPVTGFWSAGDIRYNTTPTVGSFILWECTVSGTPGTWKGFGQVTA